MANLYPVLIHYPVINKNGEVIASAITNLDIHDIARASKTYGVKTFYIVSPIKDQRILAERIVSYWIDGAGSGYNPHRNKALDLISILPSLDEVTDEIEKRHGVPPKIVATSAKKYDHGLDHFVFRKLLKNDTPYLLAFGTAWGLSETFITEADHILDPIVDNTGYNHLSVRSAVAIILDRLMGDERNGEKKGQEAVSFNRLKQAVGDS